MLKVIRKALQWIKRRKAKRAKARRMIEMFKTNRIIR